MFEFSTTQPAGVNKLQKAGPDKLCSADRQGAGEKRLKTEQLKVASKELPDTWHRRDQELG